MAITYGAQAGTQITTSVVGVNTLGSQTGAGSNEIYVAATGGSTLPSTADDYNNDIGPGTDGLGDTYVGRVIVVRKGAADQEIRIVTAVSYATNVQTLTVNEDWDVQPASGDAYDVCYEPGDITEFGGAGLSSKTGLYELSNLLTINSTGFFQAVNGNAIELDDDGNNISFIIQSGGYFVAGLTSGGADISGGVMTSFNNGTGEPSTQIQSGGNAFIYDTLLWAQLVAQQYECADGSNGNFSRVKWLNLSDELFLYDATITDCSVSGKAAATDIVRVDAGTTCNEFVVSNIEHLDSIANTTTETIELTDVLFAGVTDYITIRDNKTWNMIDPSWSVTDHTDFDETQVTGTAVINDRTSVTATVAEADGTLLQDALVNIYSHEFSIDGGGANAQEDLVLELVTDVNGFAADSFIYTTYGWATGAGTNTVYSGHALQCGKWLYEPFVSTQASNGAFLGTITLSPDTNIVQTTQATAITNGSGITWNEDTNPSEIFEFTLGSGTLAVGMIITFTSGAVGTITELLTGDSTAGTVHLDTRNATAITNGDTFSRTGGTAGTFSGTYTNDTAQSFTIHIDGNSLSLQTIYDYLSARQTETTLTADGELIWEWCRDTQTQPLYNTGSSFFTERSSGKGLIIVNAGGGSVDYYTSDDGTTWTPPVNYTLTIGRVQANSNVHLFRASDKFELTFAIPVTVTDFLEDGVQYYKHEYAYQTPEAGTDIEIKVTSIEYTMLRQNATLDTADARVNVFQQIDRNYDNPDPNPN